MKRVFVMLLFLQCSLSENSQVLGPDYLLYGVMGSELLLPCWIKPSASAVDMRVEWFRPDQGNSVVHLYKDRGDIFVGQILSYIGRTTLVKEMLQNGNASLRLSNVRLSDEGHYTCYINDETWYDDFTFRVAIEAVGTDPVITLESFDSSGGFSLLCESNGWFPEPELQWMGEEGVSLTDGVTKTHKDGELFSVKHRIFVPNGGSGRFYCRVKLRHHMKTSEIIVSNEIFSTWRTAVTCVSIAALLMIVEAAVIVYMIHKVAKWKEDEGKKVLEVDNYVKKLGEHRLEGVNLSPPQWASLAVALCNSSEEMEEFDLGKYKPSHEAMERLELAIKSTKRAVLRNCNLSAESSVVLASVLKSESCKLRELNLNENNLYDTGVKNLSEGLMHPNCSLQKLRLSWCCLTEESCEVLCSVLKSELCRLTELELSVNDLFDSGVKKLSSALEHTNCELEVLRLRDCKLSDGSCVVLSSALTSIYCSLTELELSENKLQDSGVKNLSTGLNHANCNLQTLRLRGCSLSGESCSVLSSVLISDSCCLTELELSNNKLENSGVKMLCTALNHPQCNLQILRLEQCWLTDEGYSMLAEALRSNPSSNLRELYLKYTNSKESGIKQLWDLTEDIYCKLEKLQ